jgi:hypothetical protein
VRALKLGCRPRRYFLSDLVVVAAAYRKLQKSQFAAGFCLERLATQTAEEPLASLRFAARTRTELVIENLPLRQQLANLQHASGQPSLHKVDRASGSCSRGSGLAARRFP